MISFLHLVFFYYYFCCHIKRIWGWKLVYQESFYSWHFYFFLQKNPWTHSVRMGIIKLCTYLYPAPSIFTKFISTSTQLTSTSTHLHPSSTPTQLISASTYLHPSPPTSIRLHSAHFRPQLAFFNTLNVMRTKISHVIWQFSQI